MLPPTCRRLGRGAPGWRHDQERQCEGDERVPALHRCTPLLFCRCAAGRSAAEQREGQGLLSNIVESHLAHLDALRRAPRRERRRRGTQASAVPISNPFLVALHKPHEAFLACLLAGERPARAASAPSIYGGHSQRTCCWMPVQRLTHDVAVGDRGAIELMGPRDCRRRSGLGRDLPPKASALSGRFSG